MFVGSGISQWSGVPSWKGLIQKMIEFLGDRDLEALEKCELEKILSRGDLTMATSLCASQMRKSDFRDFIDEIFIKPNPRPHEIHHIIVGLGPDSFITTSYDRLIQDAYQSVNDGLVLFSVNNDQPIEQARLLKHGASRFMFTLHGSAEKSDTIVLRREDYRKLRFTFKHTIETLQHLLISRPVVYLGFGLRDPDFIMIKDEIAATYHGAQRDHFAIIPDMSQMQKKFWKKQYGINILSYRTSKYGAKGVSESNAIHNKHGKLFLILQQLHQDLKKRSTLATRVAVSKERFPFAVQSRSSLIRYCEALIYTSQVRRLKDFKLTAIFRSDISPDTEPSRGYTFPFGTRKPVLELLDSLGSLVLIGSPGAGKTHAVRAYAAILARKTLSKLRGISKLADTDIRHSIPLVLPMKEYTGDIKEMIVSRLPRSVDANKALESGCLVLIFDAVNEVSRDLIKTKVLADNVSWLIHRFPGNRFIFTSRTMNYVSAWALPVFELQPISYRALEHNLKEDYGVSLGSLQGEMTEILRNPLFLTLFAKAKEDDRGEFSSAASLLGHYLSTMEEKASQKTTIKDLSLIELLAPIAYRMLDQGLQTIGIQDIWVSFRKPEAHILEHSKSVNILNTLISLGVLVPDAEGKLGFFHQSLLEYLAAIKLSSLYNKNPVLLEEKINLLRWDETILLFVTLLPSDQRNAVLRKIAENDILFACRIFESATVKEKIIGVQLFDIIGEKLSEPLPSTAEKRHLAKAIRLLAPYGRKEVLAKLLDDSAMADAASIFLARMGAKEAIPQIIKLLLKDNIWPSDFAKALGLLADESIVPKLIELGKEIKEEGLLTSNLAMILRNFESDPLYSEILRLAQSEVVQDRLFAAEVLQELDSKRAKECLAKMLPDPEYHVRWRAIFGLRGGLEHGPYRTTEIVSQMFKFLADKNVGDNAAGYLRGLKDHMIAEKAAGHLKNAVNEYERINICAVIAKDFPETSKSALRSTG